MQVGQLGGDVCRKHLRMVLPFRTIPALEAQMKDGLIGLKFPALFVLKLVRPHNSAIAALWLDKAPTDSPGLHMSEQAKNVFMSCSLF